MDERELFDHCTNVLPGHGPRKSIQALLQEIADSLSGEERPDTYGEGDHLAAFEREVAEMFGKVAAVFMPSGTMAQQIALRLWCDQTGKRTVAMHPSSHLEFAELLGYQFLHGIHREQFGIPEMLGDRLLTTEDFEQLPILPGVVLLELPCRPLGGQLPEWDDLTSTRDWAVANGIPMHLDGARIWQCRPFYGKSFEEIGALFDSIYVSFYKDIGGLAGCMLIADEEFIDASRVWQRRHGGNLVTQAPFVASAHMRLKAVLPRIDGWVERAREVAAAFAACDGVRVNPDPPHVNFFQLYIDGDADTLVERHHEIAERTGTFLFSRLTPSRSPGMATTEIHVWENGTEFDLDALQPFMAELT